MNFKMMWYKNMQCLLSDSMEKIMKFRFLQKKEMSWLDELLPTVVFSVKLIAEIKTFPAEH
jgi:hypothetical protein